MPTTKFATVDEYLAAQPAPARAVLAEVRAALRAALPGAEEIISYQIPAYRLHGRVLLYFAGWKKHFSLYPVTAALLPELAGVDVEKGTARFPWTQPVPVALLARLAHLRAAEEAAAPRRRS